MSHMFETFLVGLRRHQETSRLTICPVAENVWGTKTVRMSIVLDTIALTFLLTV